MTEMVENKEEPMVESGEECAGFDQSPSTSFCESVSSFCSFDDGFHFGPSHKLSYDELPVFSIQSVSPSGRSLSPIDNEPLSLLNLSISPISSMSDLSGDDDTEDGRDDHDPDRISLEEINAQINTPPSSAKCTSKRLNLETIFEGVFLETPPKKRRYDAWGVRKVNQITVERINTYVMEQRQKNEMSNDPNRLCDIFENKIDIC